MGKKGLLQVGKTPLDIAIILANHPQEAVL
jgi:hypothetical protein